MNPKRKGGAFEREIAVALSLWISHGRRKDLLWRTSMSGGRATVGKGSVAQSGDICAIAPDGHAFCDINYIECKHLKSLDITALLQNAGKLLKHWRTTCQEATRYGRMPVLIARQNMRPTLFITNGIYQLQPPVMIIYRGPEPMYIYLFDTLMGTKYHGSTNGRPAPQRERTRRVPLRILGPPCEDPD